MMHFRGLLEGLAKGIIRIGDARISSHLVNINTSLQKAVGSEPLTNDINRIAENIAVAAYLAGKFGLDAPQAVTSQKSRVGFSATHSQQQQ